MDAAFRSDKASRMEWIDVREPFLCGALARPDIDPQKDAGSFG